VGSIPTVRTIAISLQPDRCIGPLPTFLRYGG